MTGRHSFGLSLRTGLMQLPTSDPVPFLGGHPTFPNHDSRNGSLAVIFPTFSWALSLEEYLAPRIFTILVVGSDMIWLRKTVYSNLE